MAFWRTFNSLIGLLSILLINLAHADSWELKKRDVERDISVYQRPHSESPFDVVYARTQVQAELATVIAVLTDYRAMPQWFARVKAARLEKKGAAAKLFIEYELPYPFKQRHAVLRVTKKRLSAATIELVAVSDSGFRKNADGILIRDSRNRWRITQQPNGKTLIELWGESNPSGLIPAILYNFNVADDAMQTIKQLRRMLLRPEYQTKALQIAD